MEWDYLIRLGNRIGGMGWGKRHCSRAIGYDVIQFDKI